MEFTSNKPIFVQIRDYYMNLINIGALKEGDIMPSVREVALLFKVNPNTVQRAFTMLVEDGYLNNIPKKGFFVNKIKVDNKIIIKDMVNQLYEKGISKKEIIEYLKGEKDD